MSSHAIRDISGGVCAPKGFSASGVHCGIRKSRKKRDLALIVSEVPAVAAAVYTTNLVVGAPIVVTRENIADGRARALIANSGNANTCNANGADVARAMCEMAASRLGIDPSDFIIASTGVIGQPLDLAPIEKGIDELVASLGDRSEAAAEAIMTTDTVRKEAAVEFELGGATCRIGAIAKGSGMINPNMATLLVLLTSDAAISPEMARKLLALDVPDSFNMVTVDNDTSTNDMMCLMANGLAGN
jgi:glutamate N-acetyltransferase/amino-acid N-acetyltransferase